MNIEKKVYTNPEFEVEKFVICCANTVSFGDPDGLEGSDTNFTDGEDWDF